MTADTLIGCEPGAATNDPENFYNQAIKGTLGPTLSAAAKSLSKEEFIRQYHERFLNALEVEAIEADPTYKEAQRKILNAKSRHRNH